MKGKINRRVVYDEEGNRHILCNVLGSGGQGCIFRTEDDAVVIKAKTDGIRDIPIEDHEAYVQYRNAVNEVRTLPLPEKLHVALPVLMLRKPFCGYIMQLMSGMQPIQDIMTPCVQPNLSVGDMFRSYISTGGVLAGVSGTGKSLLPKLYSHFGCLYYLSMPVQPDWDSPQSIFGYFNSLDNTFNATDLLKAMVQFQDKNGVAYDGGNDLSDRMLLVLLDEINLAHVELYFSDMLSKLEERRGDRENVSIHIDLGGNYRYKVGLSHNVLWVGTMNEDENTKSLSDKVIDRSCLISFPRPKTFERRSNPDIGEKGEYLRKLQWEKWCNSRLSPEQLIGIEQYKADMERINEALEVVGRALGHRVWQAIENYIANHPKVIKAYWEQDNLEQEMQLAFEEALVYKVMPKLRGIEITRQSKEDCFDRIQAVIDESAPNLREDFAKALSLILTRINAPLS